MDEEYISLDEALRELQIGEAELRAMVTRGQLRTFGRAGQEQFRRNDIDNLKNIGQTQPDIAVPDDQAISADEEPMPVLGDDEPLPFVEEDPLAPVEQPEPLFSEEESPTEMPLLSDDDAQVSDTVMPTIELSPEEANIADVDEEHTDVATQEVSLADEDYLILEEDKAPTSAMEQPDQFAAQPPPAEVEQEEPEEYVEEVAPHGLHTLLLGALTFCMLLSMIVFVGASWDHIPEGVRGWLNETGAKIGLLNE